MMQRRMMRMFSCFREYFENLNDVQEQQEGAGDAEGEDEDVQLLRLQLREVSLPFSSCM